MGINLLSSGLLIPVAGLLALGLIIIHLYITSKQHTQMDISRKYIDMGIDFFDDDERYLSIKDGNLSYFLVNKALSRIHGEHEENYIGLTDEDIFPSELAEKLQSMDRKVLETGRAQQVDLVWREKTYRIRKFPLILPDGNKGVGINGIDISDAVKRRKERERIIRRNEILIDVFTRDFSTSHDQLDYVLKKALVLTEWGCGAKRSITANP